MTADPLFDEDALAKFLGVAAGTLKNWRQQAKGPPYVRAGKLIRYRRADVEAWLKANGVKHD